MKLEIANRLYEYRRASGMSQEKVASMLGVSRQAVSKWECAESSPDTDNLIALAQLYGVSIDELLFADPEVPEAVQDAESLEAKALAEVAALEEVQEEAAEEPADEAVVDEDEKPYSVPFEEPVGDYADISLERGVHVRDSKAGEEVHVGWDGIHIDTATEHVHIDFNNFKDIAQAIRVLRKTR